jgi:hypothetical protein
MLPDTTADRFSRPGGMDGHSAIMSSGGNDPAMSSSSIRNVCSLSNVTRPGVAPIF